MSFSLHEFARGFVAKLRSLGHRSICEMHSEKTDGFNDIYGYLQNVVHSAIFSKDNDWYIDLCQLRNEFAPSNIGTFDRFEAEISRLDHIFMCSQPYAECLVNEIEPRKRHVFEEAARIFIDRTIPYTPARATM